MTYRPAPLMIAAVIAAMGCGRPPGPEGHPEAPASLRLDPLDSVRLASFPEIVRLSEQSMAGLPGAKAYCLRVDLPASPTDSTPTPELLAALANRNPPVVSIAACSGVPGRLTAAGIGEGAWVLWVAPARRASDTMDLTGGYNAGPLAAAEWTCTIVRTSGEWNLIGCRMNWIS